MNIHWEQKQLLTSVTKINLSPLFVSPIKAAAQARGSHSAWHCTYQRWASTSRHLPQISRHVVIHCHKKRQFFTFTPAPSHIWPQVSQTRCRFSLKMCSGCWRVSVWVLGLTNEQVCFKKLGGSTSESCLDLSLPLLKAMLMQN